MLIRNWTEWRDIFATAHFATESLIVLIPILHCYDNNKQKYNFNEYSSRNSYKMHCNAVIKY